MIYHLHLFLQGSYHIAFWIKCSLFKRAWWWRPGLIWAGAHSASVVPVLESRASPDSELSVCLCPFISHSVVLDPRWASRRLETHRGWLHGPEQVGTHHTRTWVNFPHIDKKLLNPSSEINNRACLLDAYIWTQKGSQKGSPQAQDSSVWLLAALSRDRWCASAVDLYTGREAHVSFDRTAENNYSLCLSIPPSLPSSQSWWRVGCNTVSSSERQ